VALSADGNTALIGAPDDNSYTGAAWVYTRSGAAWAEQSKIVATADEIGPARLGSSVALSGDGSTALIGGIFDDVQTGQTYGGAAWVYTRSGTAWSEERKLATPADAIGGPAFGYSAALSSDGSTALISGSYDNSGAGAVWEFARSGSAWSEQQKIAAPGDAVGDPAFGSSLAMSGAGGTALIGGVGDGGGAGAAWVFTGASQSITFPAVGTLYAGPAPVTLHATASSGLPVSYTVVSGPCTVSGATLHHSSVGSCVVAASQAGSPGYAAAPVVTQTITVKADAVTTCTVTSTVVGPPAKQEVTVQNTASGLSAITNVAIVNGTVSVPSFTAGTTAPVVVTATKSNQSLKTSWSFAAADVAGNVKQCA
jgi:hypothetical protein